MRLGRPGVGIVWQIKRVRKADTTADRGTVQIWYLKIIARQIPAIFRIKKSNMAAETSEDSREQQ